MKFMCWGESNMFVYRYDWLVAFAWFTRLDLFPVCIIHLCKLNNIWYKDSCCTYVKNVHMHPHETPEKIHLSTLFHLSPGLFFFFERLGHLPSMSLGVWQHHSLPGLLAPCPNELAPQLIGESFVDVMVDEKTPACFLGRSRGSVPLACRPWVAA